MRIFAFETNWTFLFFFRRHTERMCAEYGQDLIRPRRIPLLHQPVIPPPIRTLIS